MNIGSHMNGYKDDELEGRWYQLGVFSPVNRLPTALKTNLMERSPGVLIRKFTV